MLEYILRILKDFRYAMGEIIIKFITSIKYTFFCLLGVLVSIILDGINNPEPNFEKLTNVIKNFLGFTLNPNNIGNFDPFKLGTFIFLCVLTLGITFLFDGRTIRSCFLQGLGIVSVFFNNTPEVATVVSNSHNSEIAQVALAPTGRFFISQGINKSLQISLTGKESDKPARIIVKSPRGAVYYNFLSYESQNVIEVPREDWYQIIVEVEGYQIEDRVIYSSETSSLNINLSRSNNPIGVQRVYRSIFE